MSGTFRSFPKPVHTEKPRKGLKRSKRVRRESSRKAQRGIGGGMFAKSPSILDRALLRTYSGRPCVECGGTETHAHHYVNRSFQRLDIPWNLDPFCWDCHRRIEDGDHELEQRHFQAKGSAAIELLRSLAPGAGIFRRVGTVPPADFRPSERKGVDQEKTNGAEAIPRVAGGAGHFDGLEEAPGH